MAESGTCNFGRMKMSWTSKAPFYDMDFHTLNKQRVRQLHFPPKLLGGLHKMCSSEQMKSLTLSLLARRRLKVFSEQRRMKYCMQDFCSQRVTDNLITLTPLSASLSNKSRPNRTPFGSLCTEVTESDQSKVVSCAPSLLPQ